jgi:CO/xanthine dehydrogenase Mo-binding subunit
MPRRRRRTRCVSRSGEILGLEEQILGLEERCIRVVAPDVGGGFGPKARLYPEEIVLAALALELDHPVRWIEERNEHLLTSAHTRDHHYRVTAYADRQGKVLGIDCEITVDAGAYGLWPQGPYQEANMAARSLPGPYAIPHYRARTYTVATNKAPVRAGSCSRSAPSQGHGQPRAQPRRSSARLRSRRRADQPHDRDRVAPIC